jgi:hypothetical protein
MRAYVIDTLLLKKQEEWLGFRLTSAELDEARNSEGVLTVMRGERTYHLKLEVIPFTELYDSSFDEEDVQNQLNQLLGGE